MSLRKKAPSNRTCRAPARAFSRASATVSPRATDVTTRPPSVTSPTPGSYLVPAWRIRVPAGSSRRAPDAVAEGHRGVVRVVARSDHDAEACARVPAQVGMSGEPAFGRRQSKRDEVALQARQHHLGLRVPEPGVELERPETAGGEHEPRVEHAAEWIARGGELLDRGPDDAIDDLTHERVIDAHGR